MTTAVTKTVNSYTIDATGKKLGRIASEAAKLLTAKNHPTYARNVVPNIKVTIENASKIDITEAKLKDKFYKSFSGFAGGLKLTSRARTIEKLGYGEVFEKTVYGMLPHNSLRSKIIKNLTVKE